MSTGTMKSLPHHDLRLPDGRLLRYDPRGKDLAIDQTLDKASWLTPNGMRVIASIDVTHAWGPKLHVSLSYRNHDPSWDEIKQVKSLFFGDAVDAMLPLPKAEDYVAGVPGWENSHVFHLWEMPEAWGMR